MWKEGILFGIVPRAHPGPIFDLAAWCRRLELQSEETDPADYAAHEPGERRADEEVVVLTGGADGWVRVWQLRGGGAQRLEPGVCMQDWTKGLMTGAAPDSRPSAVRSLSVCRGGAGIRAEPSWRLLVGTAHNQLWLITLPHLRTAPFDINTEPMPGRQARAYVSLTDDGVRPLPAVELITQGHSVGACRPWASDAASGESSGGVAIAAHRLNENEFATCGADGVVRLWDAAYCTPILAMNVQHLLADALPSAHSSVVGDDYPLADPDLSADAPALSPGGGGGLELEVEADAVSLSGRSHRSQRSETGGAREGFRGDGGNDPAAAHVESVKTWSMDALAYSHEWSGCCHLALSATSRETRLAGGWSGVRGRADKEVSRLIILKVSDAVLGEDIPLVCVLGRANGLANRRVTALRYSPPWGWDPGGEDTPKCLLAAGAWDGSITVFDVDISSQEYQRIKVLKDHVHPVSHLDFGLCPNPTEQPQSLQSNSWSELKYWDLTAWKLHKSAAHHRDTLWSPPSLRPASVWPRRV